MRQKIFFLVFIISFAAFVTSAQINFPLHSDFKYIKATSSTAIAADWYKPSSLTVTWSQGQAPFWYGDGSAGTAMSDMRNAYSTFYLRSTFTAKKVDLLSSLQFTFDYDDGFVLYINGVEVLSRNAPTARSYNSFAPENHESGAYTSAFVERDKCQLVEGVNTIAVHVFNVSLTSSDVFFDVAINAEVEKPAMHDSLIVDISQEAGFYDLPLGVNIQSPMADYRILYTLDGSNPQRSTTAKIFDPTTSLLIDPNSTIDRPQTAAVVLRACLDTDSLKPGKVVTRTYIFPNKVEEQSYPGAPWPSSNVNDQELNYGVSSDISTDIRYKNRITASLKAVSTLSIVTDAANLFDASSGIYVNAMEDGVEWERPCSFELINPDGSDGFQVGAGLRIRGGWSRHDNFPKHAFRLFFRKEYGDAKLEYPLFGDEGDDEYDKIDLRTSQNYAWSLGRDHNTMLRDVFSRDLQGDMGQPYTRSRYYHLYINGLYFGLYQTQERAEANFAATYMGGDKEDYDVVKADRVNGILETTCTDGTINAWENVWQQIASSMSSNERYFNLIGCDAEGESKDSVNTWVDVENLIDYMAIIFYTGNYDAPVSKFTGNNNPNNYYGIYKNDNPLKGFQFLAHDSEHSLFYGTSEGPGIGLQENRVNLHTRSDDRLNVTQFKNFTPQWLHARLTQNTEYRVKFADRAYAHFSSAGVMSQEAHAIRLKRRMAEVEEAMIAESLKWGGAAHSPAYNVIDDWKPEVASLLNQYFPQREAVVIQQLKDAHLYPTIDWPNAKVGAISIDRERYDFDEQAYLTLSAPSGATLAYTLNGDDPRRVGGSLSPEALTANGTVDVSITQATLLTMRSYNGSDWSAVRHIYLTPTADDWQYLKVTELHYHPLDSIISEGDTIGSDKFEFIEFKNIHPFRSINIGGLKFQDGITYDFPANYILGPQEFFVIASSAYKFYQRYGKLPSGDFSKNFSNGGENIRLVLPNDSVFVEFSYQDESPWLPGADGWGNAMVSYQVNPVDSSPDHPIYWGLSAEVGGSPFSDDDASKSNSLSVESVKQDDALRLILVPNPSRDEVSISMAGIAYDKQINVKVSMLTGQVLFASPLRNHSHLSMASLSSIGGVYLISAEVDGQVYVSKLIYRP
ncbi:MAG: CotH kinase family protein [Bacteroidales bacterium]|jgi:hypothetical protein|nr:CotH kinase family protein [Bacteroidales bacterium]